MNNQAETIHPVTLSLMWSIDQFVCFERRKQDHFNSRCISIAIDAFTTFTNKANDFKELWQNLDFSDDEESADND